jgi:hypothetical protein
LSSPFGLMRYPSNSDSFRRMPLLVSALVFAAALVGLFAYTRARHVGRCSHCGRGLVAGTPLRWCVTGHKLHLTCVGYAMNREVCPLCGIYVSESAESANPVVSAC